MTDKIPSAPADSLAALRQAAPARRRRRRWLWAAAAVLLLAGGAWLGLQRPVEVQASTVASAFPSAQFAQLSASGYVVAQRRAAVASKATGRLVELRVREGSVVRQGELLGRIDAADVQAALLAAQAGLRQAAGALAQAEAQRQLAQVERGNAEAEWQRAQALKAQGFLSQQAVEASQRRVDGARAGVVAAEAAIQAAQGAEAVAQAQLGVQRVNLGNTEIRAPFDGVVLVKNANVGDMITPFSSAGGTQGAVVTMADMGTLEVEADVSESNVSRIRIDMPVEITLDALPDVRLPGSVVRIVPTVDRAKATVMTKIRFERPDPRVLPEMSAKVSFLSQRPAEADGRAVTAVHPKTVIEREGARLVLRVGAAGVLEAVPVKPGRTLGDLLEVEGALKPGDRLVLSPAPELKPGGRVSVKGG